MFCCDVVTARDPSTPNSFIFSIYVGPKSPVISITSLCAIPSGAEENKQKSLAIKIWSFTFIVVSETCNADSKAVVGATIILPPTVAITSCLTNDSTISSVANKLLNFLLE